MFVFRFSKTLFLMSLVVLAGFSLVEKTQAASLNFTPSSTTFKQGCSAKIDLVVDTQGVSTNAVDAVVLFNSSEVEIEDQVSGTPGTQIRPGNVYEIYAGNLVNESEGKILLTAFSVMGNFNGSGLLASIYFHSKPGVTNTTFQFQFTPGASTDSNVADLNGADVLSSVNSAAYTFQTGPCVPDTQAPAVSQVVPANNATNVPLSTNISLHITDNQSGVDLNTVEIQVHNVVYTPTSPELTLTGLPLDYAFSINPANDFPAETEIIMVVRATDIDGNVMSPKIYSFNRPVPPPPPPPPPPVPVCGNNIVESGEACEPPNSFACSATCQVDVLQCLTVDPQVMEQLALEGISSGTFDPGTVGSITDLETLQEVLRARAAEDDLLPMIGGAFNDAVEVVNQSARTIIQKVGCTEDCLKFIYGENSERWYIPTGVLILLIIMALTLLYLAYKKIRQKHETSQEEGRKMKPKKKS